MNAPLGTRHSVPAPNTTARAMLAAINAGDLDTMQSLLDAGLDPNEDITTLPARMAVAARFAEVCIHIGSERCLRVLLTHPNRHGQVACPDLIWVPMATNRMREAFDEAAARHALPAARGIDCLDRVFCHRISDPFNGFSLTAWCESIVSACRKERPGLVISEARKTSIISRALSYHSSDVMGVPFFDEDFIQATHLLRNAGVLTPFAGRALDEVPLASVVATLKFSLRGSEATQATVFSDALMDFLCDMNFPLDAFQEAAMTIDKADTTDIVPWLAHYRHRSMSRTVPSIPGGRHFPRL